MSTTQSVYTKLFNLQRNAVSQQNDLNRIVQRRQLSTAMLGDIAMSRAFLDYDMEYQPHIGVIPVAATRWLSYIYVPTRRGWVAIDDKGHVIFSDHYVDRLNRFFNDEEVEQVKLTLAKAVVCGLSLKGFLIYLDNCDNRPMEHYHDVMDRMNKAVDMITDVDLGLEIKRECLLS